MTCLRQTLTSREVPAKFPAGPAGIPGGVAVGGSCMAEHVTPRLVVQGHLRPLIAALKDRTFPDALGRRRKAAAMLHGGIKAARIDGIESLTVHR